MCHVVAVTPVDFAFIKVWERRESQREESFFGFEKIGLAPVPHKII
jgi:hypothetical protein